MIWSQRKHLWAIDTQDGVLLGYHGVTALYDRRKDAASVLKTQRHIGNCIHARIVKVEVSYREVSRRNDAP